LATLFEAAGLEKGAPRPLADRLRPTKLVEVVGQEHLVGANGTLTRMLKSGRLPSLILWGPPGSGKTTVARLLAHETQLEFEQLSAIFSGVQDLRKAFDRAKARREQGRGTLLFIDEIHRFNRAQQDSFLPHMEDGTITLVGATTENPSFELNGALLSRASVLVFNRLAEPAIEELIGRAERVEKRPLPLDPDAREAMIVMADGDGRAAINLADEVFAAVAPGSKPLDRAALSGCTVERGGFVAIQKIVRVAVHRDAARRAQGVRVEAAAEDAHHPQVSVPGRLGVVGRVPNHHGLLRPVRAWHLQSGQRRDETPPRSRIDGGQTDFYPDR